MEIHSGTVSLIVFQMQKLQNNYQREPSPKANSRLSFHSIQLSFVLTTFAILTISHVVRDLKSEILRGFQTRESSATCKGTYFAKMKLNLKCNARWLILFVNSILSLYGKSYKVIFFILANALLNKHSFKQRYTPSDNLSYFNVCNQPAHHGNTPS